MGDYLTNLVDKSLGQAPVVEIRQAPRFAPSPYLAGIVAQPAVTPPTLHGATDDLVHLREDLPTPVGLDLEPESDLMPTPAPLRSAGEDAPTMRVEPPLKPAPREQSSALPSSKREQSPRFSPTPAEGEGRTQSALSHLDEPTSTQAERTLEPILSSATARANRHTVSKGDPQPPLEESVAVESDAMAAKASSPREQRPARQGNLALPEETTRPGQRERETQPSEPTIVEQIVIRQSNAERLATIRPDAPVAVYTLPDEPAAQPLPLTQATPQPALPFIRTRTDDRQTREQADLSPAPVAEGAETISTAARQMDSGVQMRADRPPPSFALRPQRLAPVAQPMVHPPEARPTGPNAQNPPESAQRTIQVTIGRVEIRASAPPPATPTRKTERAPALSLEEYLRSRRGEESRGGKDR